jgi:D-glycero-alpha-D-manno-heptose 1-phosphate guanylyltransferase
VSPTHPLARRPGLRAGHPDVFPLDAVVLAGGLGTRLRAEVPDVPKPLAPVAGRPFLAWVLDHLAAQGVRRAVLSVGARHGAIRESFGDRYGPVRLAYSVESRPLGTGGAVRAALAYCATDPVLVVNGDTLFAIDLWALLARHLRGGRSLTMALAPVADTARYGRVAVADGTVTAFEEKGVSGPGPINAGVYVLSAALFDGLLLPAAFSLEADLLAPHLAHLAPAAHEAEGYFIDIGVPEDYRRAGMELATR